MEEKLDIILERLDELKQSQGRLEANQEVFTGKLDRFEGNQDLLANNQKTFGEKLDRIGKSQDALAENQKFFGQKLNSFGLGQERIERKLDDSIIEMRSDLNKVRSNQDDHQEIFNLLSKQFKIRK